MSASIPDFTETGLLPPGTYTVGIDDVVSRFGGSKSLKRSQLTKNLKLFYNFVRYYAKEIYIDGSYVTGKLSPGDIDLIVIFPPEFKTNLSAQCRFFDFSNGYERYKLHIFSFIDGENEKGRDDCHDWFTHTRPENGSVEKGIICVECEK